MNSQVELINQAKEFVDKYKSIVTVNGVMTRNLFPDEVKVGKTDGIHYTKWSKTFGKLKPSELKYIIKYLHNLTEDMLMDSILAYLRYFKTKKKSEYENEYEILLRYYSTDNENRIVKPDLTDELKLYLLEIYIGTTKLYKIGISTNISKRISNIRSDIVTKYDMVSTSVNLITYWVEPLAEDLEASFKAEITDKCKYCFIVSSEAFTSKRLKAKIVQHMSLNTKEDEVA